MVIDAQNIPNAIIKAGKNDLISEGTLCKKASKAQDDPIKNKVLTIRKKLSLIVSVLSSSLAAIS